MFIATTLLVTSFVMPSGTIVATPALAAALPAGSHPVTAPALVHCQVPCGIYGDRLRMDLLLEHAATIEKAMLQIEKLGAADKPNWNQLVRWISTKDDHAQKIQDQISEYWLAQRIKKPSSEDAADQEVMQRYVFQLVLSHQLTTAAMRCKQTTNTENVNSIRTDLDSFKAVYFTKEDLEHLQEHGGPGEQVTPTNPLQKARRDVARTDILMIGDGILMYRLNNGELPASLELLVTPDEKGRSYLDTDGPLRDPWGNPYVFVHSADLEVEFQLKSLGADGKVGGTGADADLSLQGIKDGE